MLVPTLVPEILDNLMENSAIGMPPLQEAMGRIFDSECHDGFIPRMANDSSYAFTRSGTVATEVDWEGILRAVGTYEMRFPYSRRVGILNLPIESTRTTGYTFTRSTSWTACNDAVDGHYCKIAFSSPVGGFLATKKVEVVTVGIGSEITNQIEFRIVSLPADAAVQLYRGTDLSTADTIGDATTEKNVWHSVSPSQGVAAVLASVAMGVNISEGGAGGDVEVHFRKMQYENVTVQANQNPSEFVDQQAIIAPNAYYKPDLTGLINGTDYQTIGTGGSYDSVNGKFIVNTVSDSLVALWYPNAVDRVPGLRDYEACVIEFDIEDFVDAATTVTFTMGTISFAPPSRNGKYRMYIPQGIVAVTSLVVILSIPAGLSSHFSITGARVYPVDHGAFCANAMYFDHQNGNTVDGVTKAITRAQGAALPIAPLGAHTEYARWNKCSNYNAVPNNAIGTTANAGAPAAITGITFSESGSGGYCQIVDDTAELDLAGLRNLARLGAVYKLVGGSSTSFATIAGISGGLTEFVGSAWCRAVGANCGISLYAANTVCPNGGNYTRVEVLSPTVLTTSQLVVYAAAGETIYFILNQLEPGWYSTSEIVTSGAQTQRLSEASTAYPVENMDLYEGSLTLQLITAFSGADVTTRNVFGRTTLSDNLVFVAGTHIRTRNSSAIVANSGVIVSKLTPYKIAVSWSTANSELKICVNGAAPVTAAGFAGFPSMTDLFVGDACALKDIVIYNKPMSNAKMQELTS